MIRLFITFVSFLEYDKINIIKFKYNISVNYKDITNYANKKLINFEKFRENFLWIK